MRIALLLLLLVGLVGCTPKAEPNTTFADTVVDSGTEPLTADDGALAERAATRMEQLGGPLFPGWTHGEDVAFFLRSLQEGDRRTVGVIAR